MNYKKGFMRVFRDVAAHIVSNLIVYLGSALVGGIMWPFRKTLLAWIESEIRLTRAELLEFGLLGVAVGVCVSALPIWRKPPDPPQFFEFPPHKIRVGMLVRWNAEYLDADPTNNDDEVRLTLITCDSSRVCVLGTVKLRDYPELNFLSSGTVLEVTGRVTVAGDPIHLNQVRLHIYRNS